MSVRKGPSPLEQEYMMRYGGLPSDREGLLAAVLERYPFQPKLLETAMERINSLKWSSVEFTLYLVPKPTPRPRTDGHHFYVKGAAENKSLIRRVIHKHIIATRAKVEMIAYMPIPYSQMNHAEIYLAEQGLIVPVTMGDVDNLMKTYLDMITGHLLLNDNLVSDGFLAKRYSMKPRLDIKIDFQVGYDSRYNEKRITHSKSYLDEFANKIRDEYFASTIPDTLEGLDEFANTLKTEYLMKQKSEGVV